MASGSRTAARSSATISRAHEVKPTTALDGQHSGHDGADREQLLQRLLLSGPRPGTGHTVKRARPGRVLPAPGVEIRVELAAQAEMLTSQLIPNWSTHMPNMSPQAAFSSGIITVPPSASLAK